MLLSGSPATASAVVRRIDQRPNPVYVDDMITMETPVAADVQQDLDCLVSALTAHSVVCSAILFGSTALGTRRASSDIDLRVLANSGVADLRLLNKALRLETFGKLKLPLDLNVEDFQTYEERRLLPSLERKISREGKVLYET